MAEQCIVCLNDLRGSESSDAPPVVIESIQSVDCDGVIAHVLPCKHNFHDACLAPWVERANSCPICRSKFNKVELSHVVGGKVLSSYTVEDKKQEAEVDASMLPNVIEDELYAIEHWEQCVICGVSDESIEHTYCDNCNSLAHVFCTGFDEMPASWTCNDCSQSGVHAQIRRYARSNGYATWTHIWQEVSRFRDIDLGFDLDRNPSAQQLLELERWRRRLLIARTHPATAERLRNMAAARLQPQPASDCTEELRAWSDFDKARTSLESHATNQRKRKATSPPESPREEQRPRPPLKRARARRIPVAAEASEPGPSNMTLPCENSTFLTSLLKDVEKQPPMLHIPREQPASRDYSPTRSPSSSGQSTPRMLSPSPPPLSSSVLPLSPMSSSPFSACISDHGRRQRGRDISPSPCPPTHTLSFSSKEEVQRMVKKSLRPRYQEKEITKDQFTEINREVCRKLYDRIGSASSLASETERSKWQEVANEEVRVAIQALHLDE